MRIKKKSNPKPYSHLNNNFTKVPNTMFKRIPNGNYYKVYVYLCYRYNAKCNYAFPSIRTISADTCLNPSTVQRAIKWLEENKYIIRYRKKETTSEWSNNCYYIRYCEEDEDEVQNKVIDTFEEMLGSEMEEEVEIEEVEEEIDIEEE